MNSFPSALPTFSAIGIGTFLLLLVINFHLIASNEFGPEDSVGRGKTAENNESFALLRRPNYFAKKLIVSMDAFSDTDSEDETKQRTAHFELSDSEEEFKGWQERQREKKLEKMEKENAEKKKKENAEKEKTGEKAAKRESAGKKRQRMSFPLLLGSETLQTTDLSQCVPGTAHTFHSLVASLRDQCDEFATIEAQSNAIESVEANPIDGQGLMSSIHRVAFRFVDGRQFVAILKVASTVKLERLNPIEDAARKGREEEAEGKGRDEEAEGKWRDEEAEGKGRDKEAEGKGRDEEAEGKGRDEEAEGKGRDEEAEGKGRDEEAEGKGRDKEAEGKGRDEEAEGKGRDKEAEGKGRDEEAEGKGRDEEAEGKVVEIGWDTEKMRSFLFEMCDLEERFFKLIVPLFPRHLLQILPIPFAVHPIPSNQQMEQGFLLMEDLSVKGVQPNFYEGLTAGQVESTIVQLAKLHAFTLTFPRHLLLRFRVNEYGRMDEMEDQLAQRVLSLDSPFFKRHQKTLRAFISKHNKLKTDVHERYGIRPVLCHGDLWSNNLFFNRLDNGEPGDQLSSIIDWQTCHASTGLNDVIRIIFSSVNAPLRRERMNDWLDLYFDTAERESHALNIVPPVEFPKQLRKDLFEEQRHFELTFVFLCFPTLFPQAQSEIQRRNLMERMETLFEESRGQYENIGG
ncbi:hypothetical protein niasHT_022289 [Heterodera trifolii]|uniref:CHK kinase-like domain-containing protein n=1 Tax=Heterodera trifolii TaxID=157864 RepID=A0ABD2KNX1_9BILA